MADPEKPSPEQPSPDKTTPEQPSPDKTTPDKTSGAAEPGDRRVDQPMPSRRKSSRTGPSRTDVVRTQLARVVRLVTVVLAGILALGALLVVLQANVNQDNVVVQFITDVADAVSGPFSRNNGVFDFTGKNADAKNALVNWGIAAVVWLVIGRVLATVIAPKTTR